MTGRAELQALMDRIDTINRKINDLSNRKWEIEDEIEALTNELKEVKGMASPIKRQIWATIVAQVRLEEAVEKAGL